jgi:hypothetical protein
MSTNLEPPSGTIDRSPVVIGTQTGLSDPAPTVLEPPSGTIDRSTIVNGTQTGLSEPAPIYLGAGYFGETLSRPGALLALQKGISKKNDLHHIRLNFIYYKHPGYNNNLAVLPEYLFRKTGNKGRFIEVAAGAGWMYQKPDRLIIEYDNGSFTETNSGWHYVAPTILFGGGKKVQQGALKEMVFTGGLRWFGQYPFNDFLMHHLALEVSVAIPLYLRRNS